MIAGNWITGNLLPISRRLNIICWLFVLLEILTWVSIYQFSKAGPAASVRIYFEAFHPTNGVSRVRAGEHIPYVPLGIARFPRELGLAPRTWNSLMAPKVYQSDNSRGGHFAATENPEAIVRDLNNMFSPGGIAHGAVKGNSGYQAFAAKLWGFIKGSERSVIWDSTRYRRLAI